MPTACLVAHSVSVCVPSTQDCPLAVLPMFPTLWLHDGSGVEHAAHVFTSVQPACGGVEAVSTRVVPRGGAVALPCPVSLVNDVPSADHVAPFTSVALRALDCGAQGSTDSSTLPDRPCVWSHALVVRPDATGGKVTSGLGSVDVAGAAGARAPWSPVANPGTARSPTSLPGLAAASSAVSPWEAHALCATDGKVLGVEFPVLSPHGAVVPTLANLVVTQDAFGTVHVAVMHDAEVRGGRR